MDVMMRFALVDRAHLDDPAAELDRGAHRILLPRRRIGAVKRDAGTDPIEMRFGAAEERGAVRGVPDLGRETELARHVADAFERAQLNANGIDVPT